MRNLTKDFGIGRAFREPLKLSKKKNKGVPAKLQGAWRIFVLFTVLLSF
jgi:hypothetical protein